MASERGARLLVLALVLAGLPACAGGPRRFALREPLWRDTDTAFVRVPCRPPKKVGGPPQCLPEEYVSSLVWDGIDKTIFRPFARLFLVDVGREARNVNSFDEVPDSSWFTNRIGLKPLEEDELRRGSCDSDVMLDPEGTDGSWVIDQGKLQGATPGFRVKVAEHGRFLFKVDDRANAERANAASVIGARLYHAAGFFAPCESIVDVPRSMFKLTPGLVSKDNRGATRRFDEAALGRVLAAGLQVEGRVRLEASQFIPGVPLGPFHYDGTRSDDPNDIIPHDDRRELRGARLLAAWINHFDAREQNTLNTWIAAPGVAPTGSPGYVRHYYLDFSDSLGSVWAWPGISIRLGHAYYLDFGYVLADFLTLGIIERPWDRVAISAEAPIFNYFSDRDFDPEAWKDGYPNPSFRQMTERDGAWMARIISRFTTEDVRVLVDVARLTPAQAEYLLRTLLLRQRAILRRYLGRLSPLADVIADEAGICAVDLARRSGAFADRRFDYRAHEGGRARAVSAGDDGKVCVPLAHADGLSGAPDGDPRRYRVIAIYNGVAPGPLEVHLYDLGPERGWFVAGLVRERD